MEFTPSYDGGSYVGYESDFEKEIVLQNKYAEAFQNIEQFKAFAEKGQAEDNMKALKNVINEYQQSQIVTAVSLTLGKQYSKEDTPGENIIKTNHFKIVKDGRKEMNKKMRTPNFRKFNPKFTKRENIDKKIIRRFRKYVRDVYWNNPQTFDSTANKEFWHKFIVEDIFPPVKFSVNNRDYNFKSFNTSYICWLCSQKNVDSFYANFLKEKGASLFDSIVEKYLRAIGMFTDEEKNVILDQLKSYISNFSFIYNVDNIDDMTITVTEEHSESMPPANPNSSGFFVDQLDESATSLEGPVIYKKDSMYQDYEYE